MVSSDDVGQIRDSRSDALRYLEAETLIGRAPQASLRIDRAYVSSHHASLRWVRDAWQLMDLGSRNGTWLDGQRLSPRTLVPVIPQSKIAFGHLEEAWTVMEAGPPLVMVVNVARGTQLVAIDGVVGVPSIDQPTATVYRTPDGGWCIESDDVHWSGAREGQIFEAGGEMWRICCPDAVMATVSSECLPANETFALHFLVSRDEEFVELVLESPSRNVSLGYRGHNHLLLTLARSRLEDSDKGLPATSCGWVYKEDLMSGAESVQRVDCDVFRIRQQFCLAAPDIAGCIIERRSRTRQLRIGIAALRITSL